MFDGGGFYITKHTSCLHLTMMNDFSSWSTLSSPTLPTFAIGEASFNASTVALSSIGVAHHLQSQQPTSSQQYLVELERGLNMKTIGEQIATIVSTGRHLSELRGVLLDAVLLRLSDTFRHSQSNSVRVAIYKALQRISGSDQLNRIVNVDEILRRVATVLESNDPIARAVALR
jgi:hypothetical protein